MSLEASSQAAQEQSSIIGFPLAEQTLQWEIDLAVLVLCVSDYLDYPKWKLLSVQQFIHTKHSLLIPRPSQSFAEHISVNNCSQLGVCI